MSRFAKMMIRGLPSITTHFDSQFGKQLWLMNRALFPCMVASTTFSVLACASIVREKGDFNKKSKFLNVHQRKNLRSVHSAWEPVDDQSKYSEWVIIHASLFTVSMQ
jgi:hypothetical protein